MKPVGKPQEGSERIGVIAGGGRFPVLFAETARRHGVEVVAVGHRAETDPELERVAAEVVWVRPGELEPIVQAFHRAGVRRAVMVGGIAKPRLFKDIHPDARALKVLARLPELRDDLILREIAAELEEEGIAVVESTLYLEEIVPKPGVLGTRSPTESEWSDIRFGFRAAKVIGQFDIGQSVVVRSGCVIAVEGIEGTDATIRRAGQFGAGELVLVKVCKPTQDTRFDLPAVGPGTIDSLAAAHGRALAVEAGRTITLDREEMVKRANAADIAIVAVDSKEIE
jgi:DUF1009 family protein